MLYSSENFICSHVEVLKTIAESLQMAGAGLYELPIILGLEAFMRLMRFMEWEEKIFKVLCVINT
jgi:hypothetical protein